MPGNLNLLVLSPANPLRSNSGVKYLCDALFQRGVKLELWANIPARMMSETEDWPYPVNSFMANLAGRLPRIRLWSSQAQAFWQGYRRSCPILFVDIQFMREMVWLKKLRPEKRLIQYCPEFFTIEDTPTLQRRLAFYAEYADIPDMVIDVESHRAELRKHYFNLSKDVLVITNTLPKAEMPDAASPGSLGRLARATLPIEVPILLYAGRASGDRDWDLLFSALQRIGREIYLLAFCYGDAGEIRKLREKSKALLGARMVHIADAVPRKALLASIHEADAGYVYYRPSHSINHRYAAPTKLYEYIAAGLPVISSNNPSIVPLVEESGLGVCVGNESVEALSEALESLLFDQEQLDLISVRQKDQFRSELCYEVAAAESIDKIILLLASDLK